MKRESVFLMFFLTILVTSLSSALEIQRVKASGTIYIRADGSISPPIASVNTLDNVTYVLVDNVNEGITVQRSNIIIDGKGHTMDGGNAISPNGLYLSGVNNVMVQNVTISGFYAYGIFLDNSSGNIVTGNKFTTRYAAGIMFNYSDNNILANNTFDGWIGFAGGLLYYSNNNTLYGNYVTGYSFPADAAGGFSLHFSHNNTLIGNDVSGNAQGIILANSDNNTLIANDASWSVSGGPGEAAPWGVDLLLDSSSNNTVLDNNFTNSNGPGVDLNSAFNNTLVHNNCVSDSDGIVISSSSGNVLSDNVIKNNNGYFIAVYNLTIGGNGIYLRSSSNNTIYHNSLIGNSFQASSDGSPNTWGNGYPSGGNYWSDYNGTDANQDGIGDAPYIIDANNVDNYPLMGMYSSFEVWVPPYPAGGFENVDVITNFTILDLDLGVCLTSPSQYLQPGQPFLSLTPVQGQNMTAGFCRMTVPNNILNTSEYIVLMDLAPIGVKKLFGSNSTHTILYFVFTPSECNEIQIVPEFPSFLILPLFFAATLAAAIVYKRKHVQRQPIEQ